MKYTYAYKTSDGTRHEAAMEAASREVVFEQLRAKGIKAIKVVAADGSKANGEVRGVRKRVVAVGAVAIALIAGGVAFWLGRGESSSRPLPTESNAGLAMLTSQTRRQVIGDVAVIEKGIRTGWADVFEHEGDRFLASFAIPGVKAGVRNTSAKALEECLSSHHPSAANLQHSSIESQQIVAMVEGMKQEARAYLAAGGTAVEYGKRLVERQDAEIALFKRIEAEVLAAQKKMTESEFSTFHERYNDELRNLGIRPVTLPD